MPRDAGDELPGWVTITQNETYTVRGPVLWYGAIVAAAAGTGVLDVYDGVDAGGHRYAQYRAASTATVVAPELYPVLFEFGLHLVASSSVLAATARFRSLREKRADRPADGASGA